jgi:hypothetical protein
MSRDGEMVKRYLPIPSPQFSSRLKASRRERILPEPKILSLWRAFPSKPDMSLRRAEQGDIKKNVLLAGKG